MKTFIFCLKLIFSFIIFFLALYHTSDFSNHYLKFGSSPMINEFGLEKLFYLLVFCEFLMPILIWFRKPKTLIFLNDITVLIYFPFLIIMLVKIYDVTGGCISCHQSIFEPLGISYSILLVLLICMFIFYFVSRYIKVG